MFGFSMRRGFGAALTFILLNFVCTAPSLAGNPSAFITGSVTQDKKPVADATVTAAGNNRTLRTKTDAGGHFRFPPLTLGSYLLSASHGQAAGEARVDLTIGGAVITIPLGLKEIAAVNVRSASTVHGSGGDVVLNSTALTEMPYNNSFSDMMVQLPGAARGANGVVHMNGDHGVIDFQLDGVMLPEELNRDIGGEINLNDVSYVSLIEGAYPAQYGLKFGSVFNISTRAGTGPAGFDGNASYGSYGTVNSTLGFHSPLAGGGGYDIAFSGMTTNRGLDPPDFDSPHNEASSVNQFARFTLPSGGDNYTNVTFIHSTATFQIPNDVDFGEPANTDDNENQEDVFFSAQFHHAIGNVGSWSFGPAFKSSNIQDFGDAPGDFAYGEAINLTPPPY
ncbi:MAG TPA: carboxypeptidase-like regulatory domain-containing protein, partial [Verrucomicrobiae bacterium]|nr:carboxypeptidase-like regulatory domain-containing protein [Verrucomicrobiae bacterium]